MLILILVSVVGLHYASADRDASGLETVSSSDLIAVPSFEDDLNRQDQGERARKNKKKDKKKKKNKNKQKQDKETTTIAPGKNFKLSKKLSFLWMDEMI